MSIERRQRFVLKRRTMLISVPVLQEGAYVVKNIRKIDVAEKDFYLPLRSETFDQVVLLHFPFYSPRKRKEET